jgi:Ca2+:H+ antiporter
LTEPAAGQGDALVGRARALAAERGHDAIASEHLLLVALASPAGEAALQQAGIAPDALRDRLVAGIKPGRTAAAEGELALSSQARRLIAAAGREASGRQSEPAAEHYLVAAFAEPRGSLARALSELQVSPRSMRQAVFAATGLEPLPRQQPAKEPAGASPAPAPEPAPIPEQAPKPAERPARRQRQERQREQREHRDQPAAESPRGDRRARPRAETAPTERATAVPEPPAPKPLRPLKHLRRDPDAWGPLWRRILLLAVPAAAWAEWTHQPALLVFGLACAGVIPLAGFMGDATEHLAAHTGPTIGGLLNATFGNAAELIIGLMALHAGLIPLVKYSITGSILGNLLLILGLSLIAGGMRTSELRFSRTVAGMSAGMMVAAVVGLVFPALLHATHPAHERLTELRLSEGVAVVLIATYALSLLFTLRTHRWLLGGDPHEIPRRAWGIGKGLLVLAVATAGIAWLSELLVHSVQEAGDAMGLGAAFVGLIIIPLIGNAAEHASAIMMARRGKMDLSLQIAYGSSTQIALLVAPVLVFAGVLMGQDMNLVFEPFEVMAVGLAVLVTAIGTTDGESHWFEGVMLLAVYGLIAVAAFFV